jgi:hypothetical protein
VKHLDGLAEARAEAPMADCYALLEAVERAWKSSRTPRLIATGSPCPGR